MVAKTAAFGHGSETLSAETEPRPEGAVFTLSALDISALHKARESAREPVL